MVDASFHLSRNAVQVQSWIALLEGDALKRCRRDRGSDRFFYAVPRMLMILRAMLSPEPEKRPSASKVKKCFGAAIKEIPSTRGPAVPLHCSSSQKNELKNSASSPTRPSKNLKAKEGPEMWETGRQEKTAAVRRLSSMPILKKTEPSILSSSSVSEFDFGFSDANSDCETTLEDGNGDGDVLEELDELDEVDSSVLDDFEPIVPVDRESPQLFLPDLDSNITGIETLTFRA